MKSEHWGIGVDFFQLAEIIMGREMGTWTRNWTLSGGFVWDSAQQDYKYEWDTSGTFDEIGYGFEVGLANILYYRRGHMQEDYNSISGATEGYGVNLQAGRLGGVRYDWASTPMAEGVPDRETRTWSFWVDPMAVIEVW